jgi:hypothetical protein
MAQVFKPSANTMARGSIILLATLPWLLFYFGSTISRGPLNTRQNVPLGQPVPFSHRHHVFELGIDCRYCHVTVEKGRMASVPSSEVCMSCHSQIWTNSPLLEPVRLSYETGEPIRWATGELGWTKVNWTPEFVYFDHSIHIARGIDCNYCHGPVQDMAITFKGKHFAMAWCLQCHTEPEKYLYTDPANPDQEPRERVFSFYEKLQSGAPLTPRERAIRDGGEYKPSAEEIEAGNRLVQEYRIQKQQLADCWICHR